ncbi:MAG: IclR family transcriptional regulator [Bacillota bacterium]
METVSRALKLLKLIAEKPMRVHEVAEKLGVHKSSASRLISALYKENFIRQNSNQQYELGFAVFELAHVMNSSLDLRVAAAQYLKNLNSKTNETIHLAVLDCGEVVYLDKKDSTRLVRMFSQIGKRAQPYCTGVGKALLAFLDQDELKKVLDSISFNRYTERTITARENLLTELHEIRKTGIAWDRGEHEPDIYCIAAPIFGFNQKVIASISISIMIKYSSIDELCRFDKDLLEAAASLSRDMGYAAQYPPL